MSSFLWFLLFSNSIIFCQIISINPNPNSSESFEIDSLYYTISVESKLDHDIWDCNLTLIYHTNSRGHMLLSYEGSLLAGMNQSAFGHRYKPWDKIPPQFVPGNKKDTLNITLPTFYSFNYIDPIILFSLNGVLLDYEELFQSNESVHDGFYYYFSDTLQSTIETNKLSK
jgi:hypothetical protein